MSIVSQVLIYSCFNQLQLPETSGTIASPWGVVRMNKQKEIPGDLFCSDFITKHSYIVVYPF